MFRDESITTTTHDSCDSAVFVHEARLDCGGRGNHRHREIDRALRQIAAQRTGLDVEEARWLRAAEEEGAWKQLGYVHGLEYLEDVFGYRPRTAKERLRVARELGELPELEVAMSDGDLNYSVVRELTRVATPATVAAWIDRARGKNLRDVEHMVSGRKKGDDPEAVPDPDLVDHDVVLELDAMHHALWRDLRKGIEDELGRSLDDKAFVAEVHARVFAAWSAPRSMPLQADLSSPGKSSRGAAAAEWPIDANASQAPRRTIHISTCPDCRRAWQDGAGLRIQIRAQDVERAQCDGFVCDDDRETRVTSAIPERIRRKVLERDGYRCAFTGCRASRNLEVHHVKHRADGGEHDPTNLTTLCGGHHALHHDGVITISGQAPDALVFTRDAAPVGTVMQKTPPDPAGARPMSSTARPSGPAKFAHVERCTLAKAALVQAGFRAAVARQAVDAAAARLDAHADLTALIKEALRHCN